MKRKLLLVGLFCPFLLASLSGCNNSSPEVKDNSSRPVFAQPLGISGGVEQKSFNGVIQSAAAASIAFRVSGTVSAVPVIVGQAVNKGDALALLDPHDYEVIVVELEANREEVRAENILAQAEYDRVKQASQNNAVSKVNFERVTANLAKTQALLGVVEQKLERARDGVRYTILRAPFDGIVGEIKIENFEQVLPAVPVVEIHKPNVLEAVVDIPENQLARFKTDQAATVQWYGSEEKHSATVSEVSTVAHPIKQTFGVTFALDKETEGLLPGKSVTVSVPLVTGRDAEYCVPLSAVLQKDKNSFVFLTSEQTHKVAKTPVAISRIAENELCIEGDIPSDQLIVTVGVHYLSDGQEVGQFLKNQ